MWPFLLVGGTALALTNKVNAWTQDFQGWLYGTQNSDGSTSGGVLPSGIGEPVQVSVQPTQAASWFSYILAMMGVNLSSVTWWLKAGTVVVGLFAAGFILKEAKGLVRG